MPPPLLFRKYSQKIPNFLTPSLSEACSPLLEPARAKLTETLAFWVQNSSTIFTIPSVRLSVCSFAKNWDLWPKNGQIWHRFHILCHFGPNIYIYIIISNRYGSYPELLKEDWINQNPSVGYWNLFCLCHLRILGPTQSLSQFDQRSPKKRLWYWLEGL